MEEKPKKGMKRHKSLYPLSHHHHHALMLAVKLRKIGTDKSKVTTEELKNDLAFFWEKDGNQHFRDEEEILLPVYAKYKSIEQPILIEMLLEHVKIRSIIQQILTSDENIEALMNDLGHMLDQHIRKEERIIFPMIEEALPEHELQKLHPYLHVDDIKNRCSP